MMYNLSPRLFFISMSLPVPLSVIMAWIGVDRVRKLDRKISKVSDLAAAGTIDVLKEVTTVRQFAMEAKEQERYAVTNIFRRILEQRLDSVKRITWGTIDVPFVLMHIVVVYFGINECLKNVLTPAAEILQQSPDVKQQTEQHEPIQEPVQRLQHTSQQEQVQVQKQVQQVQQELSRARAARAACRGTPAKRPEVALRGSGYCSGS